MLGDDKKAFGGKFHSCGTEFFAGWVENPIFRDSDNAEGIVEMFIGYCPKCNTVEHSILNGTQLYIDEEES